MNELRRLHQDILNSRYKIGAVCTGGGAGIFTKLLSMGGMSNVFEELSIPYGLSANTNFVEHAYLPSYCSEAAVIMLAAAQVNRMHYIEHPMVVACTASLYSEGQREGRVNHAWICIATNKSVQVHEVFFQDKRRDLQEEELERLLGKAMVDPYNCAGKTIFTGCLGDFAKYYTLPYVNKAMWREVSPIVFCGAFNPWHDGHKASIELAHKRMPNRGNFIIELSAVNADKGLIYPDEIKKRIEGISAPYLTFPDGFEIAIKKKVGTASTFVDKLNVYYNPTFIVGTDTMMRIADPKYYRDYNAAMQKLADGCSFFVLIRGHTEVEVRNKLPGELYNKCVFADTGLAHVSSTEIRSNV